MNVNPGEVVIGFIGTGVMGSSMAHHLLSAGHRMVVHNRTKERAATLIENGAEWGDTPAEVAAKSDVLFTIVGYPSDVEEVYLGARGILAHARPGSYLVDMTTSSPILARRIADDAKNRNLRALDAPVSGGDVGAREARLTIMIGGETEDVEAVMPLFKLLGTNVVHQGPVGAGQHTKMCNQIAIAGNMMGVCEAMAYALKSGLDPAQVLLCIGSGAAGSWSLNNLAPRMIRGDFDPGFYIKHFIKDMKIALSNAKELNLNTPALELALKLYEQLAERGAADLGTQALLKWYLERHATHA